MLIKVCGSIDSKEKIRYLRIENIDSISVINRKIDDTHPYGFVIYVKDSNNSLYEDWYWFTSSDERHKEVENIINKINN